MTPRCDWCDAEINRKRDYEKVEGWVQARSGGGVHHVRWKRSLNVWACRTCMDQLVSGISPQQTEMFQ